MVSQAEKFQEYTPPGPRVGDLAARVIGRIELEFNDGCDGSGFLHVRAQLRRMTFANLIMPINRRVVPTEQAFCSSVG